MKPITKPQLAKIHVLLNQLNLIGDKGNIVYQFTNGRTESTREMSQQEATALLKYLSVFDPCDKMRKKVFALAYDANIIYGDSPEDWKMNIAKINAFLKERGTVKKDINKMNKTELAAVVSQFEQIKKHNENTSAARITASMLTDLNIKSGYKPRSK
jgi:hypothetical protein